VTDDRQTDHATDKRVAVGVIACAVRKRFRLNTASLAAF